MESAGGECRGTDTKNLLVKLTCKGRMSTATATTTAKLKQATNRVLEKVIPMKLDGHLRYVHDEYAVRTGYKSQPCTLRETKRNLLN